MKAFFECIVGPSSTGLYSVVKQKREISKSKSFTIVILGVYFDLLFRRGSSLKMSRGLASKDGFKTLHRHSIRRECVTIDMSI